MRNAMAFNKLWESLMFKCRFFFCALQTRISVVLKDMICTYVYSRNIVITQSLLNYQSQQQFCFIVSHIIYIYIYHKGVKLAL